MTGRSCTNLQENWSKQLADPKVRDMKRMCVMVLCITLTGCATTGPLFTPPSDQPADKALVYFTRGDISFHGALATIFSVNGILVASMHNQGYSWLYLQPGTYKFCSYDSDLFSKPNKGQIELSLSAGQTYVLQRTQEATAFLAPYLILGQGHLQVYNQDAVSKLLPNTHYQAADRTDVPASSLTDDGC